MAEVFGELGLIIAAVVGAVGARSLRKASPPLPTEAVKGNTARVGTQAKHGAK